MNCLLPPRDPATRLRTTAAVSAGLVQFHRPSQKHSSHRTRRLVLSQLEVEEFQHMEKEHALEAVLDLNFRLEVP